MADLSASTSAAGSSTVFVHGTPVRPRVIIIGGGFAGVSVAHGLEKTKSVDIILIDSKDYFENTMGVLGAIVDPVEHSPSELLVPFSSFLTSTEIIVGKVTNVTGQQVFVKQYQQKNDDVTKSVKQDTTTKYCVVPYDILVICSGSNFSFHEAHGFDEEQRDSNSRVRNLSQFSKKLADAHDIAIVGSGIAAIELAARLVQKSKSKKARKFKTGSLRLKVSPVVEGDIADLTSSKSITIFEKKSEILPGYPNHAVQYVRKFFEEEDVTFVTNCDVIGKTVIEGPERKQTALNLRRGSQSTSCGKSKASTSSPSGDAHEGSQLGSDMNDDDFSETSSTMTGSASVDGDSFDKLFDLVIWCNKSSPNSKFLAHHFGDAMDTAGYIRVMPTMQVHKHLNVFACGDIISTHDERRGVYATQQASVIVKNIALILLSGLNFSPPKMKHWSPASSSSTTSAPVATITVAAAAAAASSPSTTPRDEKGPALHNVSVSLGDKDGFIIENNVIIATGSKAAFAKHKNDSSCIKFIPTGFNGGSLTQSSPLPGLFRFSRRSSFHMSSSQSREIIVSKVTTTVVMRFVESKLGKEIVYGLMNHGVRVHPVVKLDQIEDAQVVLRDIKGQFTVSADSTGYASTAPLLSQCQSLVVLVWPSSKDNSGKKMIAECKAIAEAAGEAKVSQVVVLCPATRHKIGHCLVQPMSPCCCCTFESCLQEFRNRVGSHLTVVYFEPDYLNPVMMNSLQPIMLNRKLLLPLGERELEDEREGVVTSSSFVSYVDMKDVIEAVIAIHDNPEIHEGKEYRLTGTLPMTGLELARSIAKATGEDVLYQDAHPKELFEKLIQFRVPRLVAMWLAYFHGVDCDEDAVTKDLKQILGADFKQMTFAEWAVNKRAMFLSGQLIDDIDLDDLLKKPEAVRELMSDVVSGKRIMHSEIDEDKLELGDVIGQGACAVVYKATYRGTTVAVKQFKGSVIEFEPEVFSQEVATISILRHPHLVSCIGACTKNPERLRIVLEYMPRGSLDSLFDTYQPNGLFPISLQYRFAFDIARAMKFLHGIGFVHGDLKPANLLVTDQLQIKLTDFDTCKFISPKMKGSMGTPDFIPPESFKEKDYTQMVDVYAFGITLWEICARNKNPYEDLSALDIPDAVIAGRRPAKIENSMWSLMVSCWDGKPSKRPNFEVIIDRLETLEAELKHSSVKLHLLASIFSNSSDFPTPTTSKSERELRIRPVASPRGTPEPTNNLPDPSPSSGSDSPNEPQTESVETSPEAAAAAAAAAASLAAQSAAASVANVQTVVVEESGLCSPSKQLRHRVSAPDMTRGSRSTSKSSQSPSPKTPPPAVPSTASTSSLPEMTPDEAAAAAAAAAVLAAAAFDGVAQSVEKITEKKRAHRHHRRRHGGSATDAPQDKEPGYSNTAPTTPMTPLAPTSPASPVSPISPIANSTTAPANDSDDGSDSDEKIKSDKRKKSKRKSKEVSAKDNADCIPLPSTPPPPIRSSSSGDFVPPPPVSGGSKKHLNIVPPP